MDHSTSGKNVNAWVPQHAYPTSQVGVGHPSVLDEIAKEAGGNNAAFSELIGELRGIIDSLLGSQAEGNEDRAGPPSSGRLDGLRSTVTFTAGLISELRDQIERLRCV